MNYEAIRNVVGLYSQTELFARALVAESGGEPTAGQIEVACVVMERVADSRWDDNVRDVLLAPQQFSCFNDRSAEVYDRCFLGHPPDGYDEAYQIAFWAMCGRLVPQFPGATHYRNPAACTDETNNRWNKWEEDGLMVCLGAIGRHVFFREI